jgi:hypothetical protein
MEGWRPENPMQSMPGNKNGLADLDKQFAAFWKPGDVFLGRLLKDDDNAAAAAAAMPSLQRKCPCKPTVHPFLNFEVKQQNTQCVPRRTIKAFC